MTYRNNFESKVGKVLGSKWKYETKTFFYIKPESKHTYTADFVKGKTVVETKGRFTQADRKKMLLVQAQHPETLFIILFQNPDNKIRKGSKTTYGMWCDKNRIQWFDFRDPASWEHLIGN